MVPIALEGAEEDIGPHVRRWRPQASASELVHILSPFDPLIIQRKRTELFFGYGIASSLCAERKALFGYFALPVLVDDESSRHRSQTDRKAANCWCRNDWVAMRRAGVRQGFKTPDRARAAPFRGFTGGGGVRAEPFACEG